MRLLRPISQQNCTGSTDIEFGSTTIRSIRRFYKLLRKYRFRNRPDCRARIWSDTAICHNLSLCGRYRLSRRKQLVEEHFDSVSGEEDWVPRYNIAPTQSVPVIRQNPKEPIRELSLMRWGLIPSWAKDPSAAVRMINARSETAAIKPAFREALKSRRCLISR